MILIFNNIMQIVFMKKKYTGSMAIFLCLALTACAKTPEQALVAQKNNERLEEAAKEGPKDGNSLKDIAASTSSTYDYQYEAEDGKVKITADQVPVTLPEKDTIPMYHVESGKIPQELTTKIYDYFFPDGAYTTTGTDMTKDEIDKRILEMKQTIANYRDDEEITEEERESIIQHNQEILASLEEERKTAPEESTLTYVPRDSMYADEEWQTMSGPVTVKSLDASSRDEKQRLSVISSDNPQISSSVSYIVQTDFEYSGAMGKRLNEQSSDELEKIGISRDDAQRIVEDFVDKIGMPWEIHSVDAVTGFQIVDDENVTDDSYETIPQEHPTAYSFSLAQTIDGIQSAITSSSYLPEDDNAVTWLYESIKIIVDKDGIVSFKWDFPITVQDTVSENVGIISFDQARDIFEQMMPLIAKGEAEQHSDDTSETTVELNVTDVRLGLMRLRNNGEELTGLMTPVWLFYGDFTRHMHYKGTAEELGFEPQDFSYTEEAPWILLAVNAVDGSVIDITAGY